MARQHLLTNAGTTIATLATKDRGRACRLISRWTPTGQPLDDEPTGRMAVMTRKTARRLRASACAALALILLSQLLSLPSAPTASASDNAAFCNNSTNRTAFLNNVLSADRSGTSGWDQYLPRLDNTDLLYLCDLDSFYTPPSTLPSGPAGTVMRIRPVYPSIGGASELSGV
jgi:hypothetical protein